MIKGLGINGLDLAVGIILLISALLAFIRGFVHEMLSIAAWAGAVAASIYGLPYARPFAHRLIPIAWVADAGAAVVIFLVVLLVLSVISHAITRTIQKSAFNNLDRSLGFMFGLARAMVILGVGLLVDDWMTDHNRQTWVQGAKTLPIIQWASDGIAALVPTSFMAPADAGHGTFLSRDGARRVNAAMDAKADAKKTLERLTMPATTKDSVSKNADTGYTNSQLHDMDRLNQQLTQPSPAEKPHD